MKTQNHPQNKTDTILLKLSIVLCCLVFCLIIYETASVFINGDVFEDIAQPHCKIVWVNDKNNVTKSWQCSSELHWLEENGLQFVDSAGRKVEIQGNIKVYGK